MEKARLILIGLHEPHRSALQRRCAERGLGAVLLNDASALPSFEGAGPVLCVLALRSDGEASPDRIRTLRKWLATSPLIVLACGIGVECAVRLIRSGVTDVIEASGPVDEAVARIARHLDREPVAEELVGSSSAMRRLREEVAAVAQLSSSVLLKGEPGVGKGAVARAIHRLSRVRNGPFVPLDCASLAPPWLPSEPSAGGGTLFLDEIGDLRPDLQASLLGWLETRVTSDVERVGNAAFAARLIAATTRDLRECVRKGRFRADLYFRLDVFPMAIPPLRERLSDLEELTRAALEQLGDRLGVTPPRLSTAVYRAMAEHTWPGNVRELISLLERALVRHHGGLFDEKQLIEAIGRAEGPRPRPGIEEGSPVSRAAVAGALVATGGNIARAARRLGVPRTTLRYRINVLGLDLLLPRD